MNENQTEEVTYAPFKKVHIYDPTTLEYLHQWDAQLSPLEADKGIYIEPETSTELSPPSCGENETIVFSKAKNSWIVVPDYRGQVIYHQKDGTSKMIEDIGPIPSEYALTLPPETREQKLTKLKIAVQNYIELKAQEKGYDSAISCISYSDSTIATWKSEAIRFGAWRDQVWVFYQSKKEFEGSTVPEFEKFVTDLPAAPW